jgi:hypothetical protein
VTGGDQQTLRENRALPCVKNFAVRFFIGRTAKAFFAVRFP